MTTTDAGIPRCRHGAPTWAWTHTGIAARLTAAGVRVDDLCECGLPDKGHPVRCQPLAAPPSDAAAPLREALRKAIVALPQPTLGLAGGVNRGAVIDAIERIFAAPKEAERG